MSTFFSLVNILVSVSRINWTLLECRPKQDILIWSLCKRSDKKLKHVETNQMCNSKRMQCKYQNEAVWTFLNPGQDFLLHKSKPDHSDWGSLSEAPSGVYLRLHTGLFYFYIPTVAEQLCVFRETRDQWKTKVHVNASLCVSKCLNPDHKPGRLYGLREVQVHLLRFFIYNLSYIIIFCHLKNIK